MPGSTARFESIREVRASWRETNDSTVTAKGTKGPADRGWMSIREASELVGVSPVTLRRWSDAGAIKAFTTPGGHRRFSRAAVAQMMPDDRPGRPTLEELGETPERMTAIYRRELQRAALWAPWIEAIDEGDRTPLRDHGQRIASALLTFFDATLRTDRGDALAIAQDSAGECGWIAGRIGLSMEATVEAFLQFRMPFIHELGAVARRRGLDTAETTLLMESVTGALDGLLTSAIRGHGRLARPESSYSAMERLP